MAYAIRQARRLAGMTQAELAQKSGVSRAIINGLETGRCVVTKTDTLAKLASALGVTVDALFFAD